MLNILETTSDNTIVANDLATGGARHGFILHSQNILD